jgi:acyl carrier protein
MADNDQAYDENALTKDLRLWWDDQVSGGAADPFASPKPESGTIFDVIPEIDSLGAVTGLITIEKHTGFEVPPRVIRRGGYQDFDDMVSDLLPKVRVLVERQKKAPDSNSKKRDAA